MLSLKGISKESSLLGCYAVPTLPGLLDSDEEGTTTSLKAGNYLRVDIGNFPEDIDLQ